MSNTETSHDPLQDEVRALRRRLAELERCEAARREAEERYRTIVETVDEIIYVTELQGDPPVEHVRFMSGRIQDLLGYAPEEFLGPVGPWFHVMHPEDRLRVAGEVARLWGRVAGGVLEYRLRHKHTGQDHWLEDHVHLRRDGRGRVVGVQGVARDVTARKRAEAERQRLEAQLQHAQKLESLGVLARGIAHDFNNLLTSVLGNAGLALAELPDDSPARYALQQIETAALRASELVSQLRACSGRGRFLVQPLDLTRLVRESAGLLQTVVSPGAGLRFDLADPLPAVQADPTQVGQVLLHLVANASEALGDRPGEVLVRTGTVRAEADELAATYVRAELPGGDYVCVEVCDTGCGMDEATLQKIFDPFFSTKFAGRGLGLAAVLGIVRGHQGAVKVASTRGQGTTVRVLFPAASAGGDAAEAWRGRGTVLVVDDEEVVRLVAQKMLERAGFDVLPAADGHAGLDAFRRHGPHVAAVLLDLNMPRLGGAEVYHELRLLRPDVPVVLMSGYGEQQVLGQFDGLGVAGFVQKPFRGSELVAVLRRILEPAG